MDTVALMRRAIALASEHRPYPNPRVGAVVVSGDARVVGEGFHRAVGEPHAERMALDAAGSEATGGTMVVTLEPHAHVGRTLPCTDAIIAAGIARVVVGRLDPNPRVAGAGVRVLRDAGITVEVGLLADEVRAGDPGYFGTRERGLPFVTLKTASTLDGQTGAVDGTSRWITGEAARRDGHRLRASHDAVLVGAGTVLADDPLLDARDVPVVRQPRPVVIAGTRPLPASARIWRRHPLVFAPSAIDAPGGEVVVRPGAGGVDVAMALRDLVEHGIMSVLVEGGSAVAAAVLRSGLVTRGVAYLAPTMAGGSGIPMFEGRLATLSDAFAIAIEDVRRVGPDLRVEWVPTAENR